MTQITRGTPPLQAIFNFVAKMFPAAYEYKDTTFAGITISYPLAIKYVIETVQMALVGTLLGVLLSLPFGLLAARNTSPHPVIYQGARLILNMIRAIPELIIALIFVSAVGLGPFGGVLALAVAGVGSKGKLYAEAIEAIDPQQVLAIRATGAGRLHAFMYGVIPQALPLILSYSLLSFETNVRAATILGYVGAGGVGILIYQYTQLFQFDHLMGVVIIIVVTVTAIDRVSDFLRRKFI
jgi:phosphonate transport system permease protein